MRKLLAPSMLLTALLCGSAIGAAPLSYPCYRAPCPPVLDGRIDEDPAWVGVPAVTGFSVLGAGYALAKQTTVQALWDAQALYLAFICEEPDVAAMKFSITDGGDAWLDDGVEIFLQPGGPGHQVYQLIVTARGARGGWEGAPDFTKVEAAAHAGVDFYSLELRIPHEVLEAQPEAGDRWRANFCRNIFTTISGGDKFTSWAPLNRQFLEPEHFGELVLQGEAPDAAALPALNKQLNDGYRSHLLQRIRDVAEQGQEYAGVLRESVRDDEFGRRARDLRQRWRRLERMLRDAGESATDELRAAALDAASLASASYELKYRYMIHKLLREN